MMKQVGSQRISLFVGNLHEGIDNYFLRNYFSRAGNVRDIYIPRNQRMGQNKYGFVRFESNYEAKRVLDRCNGDFVWGNHIVVKFAHREREEALAHRYPHHLLHRQSHGVWQSAQEAKTQSHQSNQTDPNLKHNPLSASAFAGLEYNSKAIITQWLSGCAVGYLTVSRDINDLQDCLKKQSINCSITHMGGKMVLLSFMSEDIMKEVINEFKEWFSELFDFIKPWEDVDLPKSRYVWLKCENVPLNAWHPDFFKLVGTQFGSFEAIDQDTELRRRFDHGRLLVCTPIMQHISRKQRVKVDGKMFEINISEDSSKIFNPNTDMELLGRDKEIRSFWKGETHRELAADEDGSGLSKGGNSATPSTIQISNTAGGANIASAVNAQTPQATLSRTQLSVDFNCGLDRNEAQSHSPESTQVVPESPGEGTNPAVHHCSNPTLNLGTSTPNTIVQVEEGEHLLVSNNEIDDISPSEDQYVELVPSKRASVREKRILRRKELTAIAKHASSGKSVKDAPGEQPKNYKHKYKRKRKKKEKRIEPCQASADDSTPEDNIRTRKEEIHREASDFWKLGLALGMSEAEPTDHVPEFMVELVEQDWDAYDRRHND